MIAFGGAIAGVSAAILTPDKSPHFLTNPFVVGGIVLAIGGFVVMLTGLGGQLIRRRRPGSPPKGVLEASVELANEAARDWSADEILTEYERRGTPVAVEDPRNAVFSALSRATQRGLLVRTGRGRYMATQFAAKEGKPDPDQGPMVAAARGNGYAWRPEHPEVDTEEPF